MKEYVFAVNNWKSNINRPFYVRKRFACAYDADRWAMRISFGKKDSPYMVCFCAGEEGTESEGNKTMYIVRCKREGHGGRWVDYSKSYERHEDAEDVKKYAESLDTVSVNGRRIVYRVFKNQ